MIKKSNVLSTDVVLFTPDDAQELLGKNYENNRKLKDKYISLLSEAMESGEFNSQNGQTIIVGVNGKLYDGQHRLAAQVKANVPIQWLVVVVDDGEAAYTTLDNGVRRTVADYFRDEKNSSAFGACTAFGYLMEETSISLTSLIANSSQFSTPANKMATIEYGEKHLDKLRKAVSFGQRMYSAMGKKGGKSIYSKFAYLMMLLGEDEYLYDFVEDLLTDVPDCKTCTVLKLQVANAYANVSKKPTQSWLFGSILDAYTHFCMMDDCTKLTQRIPKIKKYEKKIDIWRKKQAELKMDS